MATRLVYGIEQFGGEENLISRQCNSDVLDKDAVRVKVFASSVNPIDIKTRMGLGFVAAQKAPEQFMGLGYDVYGQVEAIGENITRCHVGQFVIGMIGFASHPGCYAQQVDASEEQLIVLDEKEKPAIAGLCLSGLTALQSLALLAVNPTKPLFINAPTGGVGHLAVQLAKEQGRNVIVLSNRPEHPLLKTLDVPAMNYKDFYQGSHDGQLLDLVGGETAMEIVSHLKPGADIVTVPTISKDRVVSYSSERGMNAQGMIVKASCDDLNKLYQAYRSGKLDVHVDQQFALSDVVQAHRYMQSGMHCGKVILVT